MEDELILELKPQYNFFAIMQEYTKISNSQNKINRAILYFWISFFIYKYLLYDRHFELSSTSLFLLVFIVIIFIECCCFIRKYKTISYKIYKDGINFIDYSNNEPIDTSLYFSDVEDIKLTQNKYQKKNDLGTIIFKIKDNAEIEYLYNSSILAYRRPIQPVLVNIKTPQFLYAKIKQLIEEEKNKTINEPVIEIKPSPVPKYLMAIFGAGDFNAYLFALLFLGMIIFSDFIELHLEDIQLSLKIFLKVTFNLLSVYFAVTIYSFLVGIKLKTNYKIYSDKIVLFYKEKTILNLADIQDIRTEYWLLPEIKKIILTTNAYEYTMYGVNNADCVCSKIKELMDNFKK